MDLELEGRVVLVTGGTSGIGLATVEALLAEGALVATCGRDPQRLAHSVEQRSEAQLDRLLAMPCDVREPDQVEALVSATIARFGRLDGLVNNAGQSRMKSYRETVWHDWVDELDLKFASVLHPLGAALPHLVRSPGASVVNINAVLARQPETRLITTSAARAGVLNLSKTLAIDLATDGIRVNSVCLGLIDTGQWRRRYEHDDTDQTWEAWSGALADDHGIVLGRLGTADEVAAAILFLLSARASYITGTTIEVSGGVSRHV